MQEVEKAVKFLSLTEGRDKIAKALQYAAKIAGPAYDTLGMQVAQVRRVQRLGKSLGAVPKLADSENWKPGTLNLLNLGVEATNLIYFFADNLIWAVKVQLWPKGEKHLEKFNSVVIHGWFITLVLSMIMDTIKMIRLRERIATLRTNRTALLVAPPGTQTKEISQVEADLRTAHAQLVFLIQNHVKNFADFQVSLRDVIPKHYNPSNKFLGWCGLLSAAIGTYQMWGK